MHQQIFRRAPPWLWSCVLICWFVDIAWAVSTLQHSHAVPRHVPPAGKDQHEVDLHNISGQQHGAGQTVAQLRRNVSVDSTERASQNVSHAFAGSDSKAAAPGLHAVHREKAEEVDAVVDSDLAEVLHHSQTKRRHHEGEVGEPRTTVIPASTDRHLLLVYPGNLSANRSAPVKEDTVEDDLDPDQKRARFFGLPKIFWALIADVVAIFIFVLGIPATLYISKRRRSPPSAS